MGEKICTWQEYCTCALPHSMVPDAQLCTTLGEVKCLLRSVRVEQVLCCWTIVKSHVFVHRLVGLIRVRFDLKY